MLEIPIDRNHFAWQVLGSVRFGLEVKLPNFFCREQVHGYTEFIDEQLFARVVTLSGT